MKAITLRGASPALEQAIRERASASGLSLNKTVLRMLEESLGRQTGCTRRLHHDLDHLAGTWSQEETEAFEADLADQRKVDPELWK